jgi:hypothetical protein
MKKAPAASIICIEGVEVVRKVSKLLLIFVSLVSPAASDADVPVWRSAHEYIDGYVLDSLRAIYPAIEVKQRVELDQIGDRPIALRYWDLQFDDHHSERVAEALQREHVAVESLAAEFAQQVPEWACFYRHTIVYEQPTGDRGFILRGGIVEYTVTLPDEVFSVRVDHCGAS